MLHFGILFTFQEPDTDETLSCNHSNRGDALPAVGFHELLWIWKTNYIAV